MKSMLKAPGTKRLKLTYDKLLSSFGSKFNLRRYTKVVGEKAERLVDARPLPRWKVRRCRLTLSNPR